MGPLVDFVSAIQVSEARVKNNLTRTSGFLARLQSWSDCSRFMRFMKRHLRLAGADCNQQVALTRGGEIDRRGHPSDSFGCDDKADAASFRVIR